MMGNSLCNQKNDEVKSGHESISYRVRRLVSQRGADDSKFGQNKPENFPDNKNKVMMCC